MVTVTVAVAVNVKVEILITVDIINLTLVVAYIPPGFLIESKRFLGILIPFVLTRSDVIVCIYNRPIGTRR